MAEVPVLKSDRYSSKNETKSDPGNEKFFFSNLVRSIHQWETKLSVIFGGLRCCCTHYSRKWSSCILVVSCSFFVRSGFAWIGARVRFAGANRIKRKKKTNNCLAGLLGGARRRSNGLGWPFRSRICFYQGPCLFNPGADVLQLLKIHVLDVDQTVQGHQHFAGPSTIVPRFS